MNMCLIYIGTLLGVFNTESFRVVLGGPRDVLVSLGYKFIILIEPAKSHYKRQNSQ